jgi:HAE1 family hydrophobic/amphiphilic exporter-1
MAKVIIGGQALSLLLALLVTPVFYALLDMWVNLTRRLGIRFAVEPRPRPAERRPTMTLPEPHSRRRPMPDRAESS